MTMGSYNQEWCNRPLEVRFDLFQKLVKQGWRIELYQLDQIENGEWWTDEVTKLPVPSQSTNRFGDIALVTWSTYVYPPESDDWLFELNASFDSPLEAYEWLAPRLEKYAKRWVAQEEEY